jgi:hypothetical protein
VFAQADLALVCIGKITRTRKAAAKTEIETAYFPLRMPTAAERFKCGGTFALADRKPPAYRRHHEQGVGSQQNGNPYNLAILRHMAN